MNLFADLENEDQIIRFELPDAEIHFQQRFFDLKESENLFDNLLSKINWRQDKIKIFNKNLYIPRLNAWYADPGLSYTYSGIKLAPNSWNEDLIFIKERLEKQCSINFNSVLINLYRDGSDSMGWHQDDEKELGKNPIIASISFGQERSFQLKHINNKTVSKVTIPLSNGSLLLMKGSTQHFWKHQIPKTTKQIKPRINLTFRNIR